MILAKLLLSLIGTWQHVGYVYQGELRDPFNPNLILIYEFNEDGTDRLFWARKNETGFCERQGQFTVNKNFIIDEVTWINPKNAPECGKDPDMIKGKVTRTPYTLVDDTLYLHLHIGDEPFDYVWKRIYSPSNSSSVITPNPYFSAR